MLVFSDVKGLSCSSHIECLRERVYSTLEEYTKSKSPDESGRFPKLLLRLPALRSIGLRCLEHLFYYKVSIVIHAHDADVECNPFCFLSGIFILHNLCILMRYMI